MAEMKNTLHAEKQSRLDQRQAESDAINQRLALAAERLRNENVGLKLKLQLRETEKKSLQTRCHKLESELASIKKNFPLDEQSRHENMSLIEQKVELEIEFEAEKKSLQTRCHKLESELACIRNKTALDERRQNANNTTTLIEHRLELENKFEAEKKSLQARCHQLESKLACIKNSSALDEQRQHDKNTTTLIEQKLELENKFEAEKKSLQKLVDRQKAEVLELQQKLEMAVELRKKEKRLLQTRLDKAESETAALSQRFAEEEQRLREENSKLKLEAERAEAEKQSSAAAAEILRTVQEKRKELEKGFLRVELEKKFEAEKELLQTQLDQQRLRVVNLELQKKLEQAELHSYMPPGSETPPRLQAPGPRPAFIGPWRPQQFNQNFQNPMQFRPPNFCPMPRHQNGPRFSPFFSPRFGPPTPQGPRYFNN